MHNNLMLAVKNVSLAFPLKIHRGTSLRDAFIEVMQSPFKKRLNANDEGFLALDEINFSLSSGDRIGLIGANGAGKTTLCRCISGFYEPRQGQIERHGKIRALFEPSMAVYPELSGRENLEILAKIFYDEEKDLEEIIEESITFSELEKFIDAPVKTYSKGMLLRLSMSLLSARPADILILDEVFDGADEFFRDKLALRIRNLINTSRVVIFVSHHQSQISEICNRVLLMEKGRVIFDGDLNEGYEMYRSRTLMKKKHK